MRKVSPNPQFWYNPIAEHAYDCAYVYINDRWVEAEPYIMKDPHFAIWYARDVIKDRWIEAENGIKNSLWREDYEKYFNCKL